MRSNGFPRRKLSLLYLLIIALAVLTLSFSLPNMKAQAASKKIVPVTKLQCYGEYRKYMSTADFQQAYKKALPLVKKAAGKPRKQQLWTVAWELRRLVDSGKVSYSTKAPHYNDPYGYLVKGVSSCAGCARTTRMCLNMLGISCEHVNENQWTHQWVRVKVGSQYWICDAYGLYVGREPGVRRYPSSHTMNFYDDDPYDWTGAKKGSGRSGYTWYFF